MIVALWFFLCLILMSVGFGYIFLTIRHHRSIAKLKGGSQKP